MDTYKNIERVSVWGIVGNLFLFIIKLMVSITSSSMGMIADTMNSGSDILASIMTYIGGKVSSSPRDDCHNLGHGKAEYIYSMLISIIIMILIFGVIKNSVVSLTGESNFSFNYYLIIVSVITIIVKLLLYIYTNSLYKKYNNILIKASSLDHRNDCFLTCLNLISFLFAYKKIYLIDGVVGILISFWLLYGAFKLFRESYDVLMDKALDKEIVNKVFEIINRHEEIKKVIHFNSTPVGYKYQISFSIFVDGNLSTFESHNIANKLEREIEKEIDEIYLTVIHVNPY